jgi:hypothetical protein
VITFNFDRSFEYRLFRMLRGSYGLDDNQAGKLCAVVPVLHIHGSLGDHTGVLPLYSKPTAADRQFG